MYGCLMIIALIAASPNMFLDGTCNELREFRYSAFEKHVFLQEVIRIQIELNQVSGVPKEIVKYLPVMHDNAFQVKHLLI